MVGASRGVFVGLPQRSAHWLRGSGFSQSSPPGVRRTPSARGLAARAGAVVEAWGRHLNWRSAPHAPGTIMGAPKSTGETGSVCRRRRTSSASRGRGSMGPTVRCRTGGPPQAEPFVAFTYARPADLGGVHRPALRGPLPCPRRSHDDGPLAALNPPTSDTGWSSRHVRLSSRGARAPLWTALAR